MSKTVKINESTLRKMISESIKKTLLREWDAMEPDEDYYGSSALSGGDYPGLCASVELYFDPNTLEPIQEKAEGCIVASFYSEDFKDFWWSEYDSEVDYQKFYPGTCESYECEIRECPNPDMSNEEYDELTNSLCQKNDTYIKKKLEDKQEPM